MKLIRVNLNQTKEMILEGSPLELEHYAYLHNLELAKQRHWLFGGYWRRYDGVCFIPE